MSLELSCPDVRHRQMKIGHTMPGGSTSFRGRTPRAGTTPFVTSAGPAMESGRLSLESELSAGFELRPQVESLDCVGPVEGPRVVFRAILPQEGPGVSGLALPDAGDSSPQLVGVRNDIFEAIRDRGPPVSLRPTGRALSLPILGNESVSDPSFRRRPESRDV